MSTTASDHDDFMDAMSYVGGLFRKHCTMAILDLYRPPKDYNMVKIGRKEYGFEPRIKQAVGGGLVARYKCSHLEAQRRFAVLLITRRMKS
jgi:hypothetical protein